MQLYEFIASSLNRNQEHSQLKRSQLCSSEESPPRFKRLLPSSISSPQRSPQPKKGHKRNTSVKKTLNFAEKVSSTEENDEWRSKEGSLSDQGCHNLNVDDLVGNQTSQAKVVIVAPSGRVENHSSFDEKTKSMILNLCRKN